MAEKENDTGFDNVDILASVEFDFGEAIKDLIWNIKVIKQDVEKIKQYINLE